MRDLMKDRITELLGPYSEYEHKFLSMRWKPVGIWLYKLKFGEEFIDTKTQKEFLRTAKLDDFLLSYATHEEILQLFELVIRRYYTQM
jgi:hypothetical protein